MVSAVTPLFGVGKKAKVKDYSNQLARIKAYSNECWYQIMLLEADPSGRVLLIERRAKREQKGTLLAFTTTDAYVGFLQYELGATKTEQLLAEIGYLET